MRLLDTVCCWALLLMLLQLLLLLLLLLGCCCFLVDFHVDPERHDSAPLCVTTAPDVMSARALSSTPIPQGTAPTMMTTAAHPFGGSRDMGLRDPQVSLRLVDLLLRIFHAALQLGDLGLGMAKV